MDGGEFEGVSRAIDAVGFEELREWRIMCIARTDIAHASNDRGDQIFRLDPGGGHAKGVANTVPWMEIWVRSENRGVQMV